nr:RNA-directed DNA polymerase, eukaryota [Tanacetum cinerariifolium]
RFIKVDNVDRLVGNLCTLWIGRMHVHANVVRFERSPIKSLRPTNPIRSDNTGAPSFTSALKGNPSISLPISPSPVMVKGTDQAKSQSRSEGLCSRILEETQSLDEHLSSEIRANGHEQKKGGSILEVLDDMIKAKKEWIKEINIKHKLNFLTLQETKIDNISAMDVKLLWGNYNFDHVFSEAVGNLGGILCTWDSNVFVALYGTWNPNKAKLLMISIYAPQSATGKRSLWSYITSLITRWNGDCMVMGDFKEVRCMENRMGSVFNVQGANEFNNFISNSGLVEVQLEGYSFTWSHPSATKMSKLDRFLLTEGLVSLFPHISGIYLDRHLSDHRPILLREVITDYGATPFRMYHSWFSLHGFEQMMTHTWNSIVLDDRNAMVRFKKKMQFLKKKIRVWVMDQKQKQSGRIKEIKSKLSDIDKLLDQGGVNDEILLSRMDLLKQLQDIKFSDARDCMQKAKIQWAIEGDENSKFFHGIINQKRANLAIKGVMVDGVNRSRLNFRFPNRLNHDQVAEMENPITRDEIRNAMWACGENKSPGPDGFTFEFL